MPAARFLLFLFFSWANAVVAQKLPDEFLNVINSKVAADSNAKLFISAIVIEGNKKTRAYIIEREMRLKKGDSVLASSISEKLLLSQQLIYNTTLFTDVNLAPRFTADAEIEVYISLKEKWYIYPTPQFQLIDRNINEWIKVYNANLERVVYGAKFAHYNLSGRRDQLKVTVLNGYTRNFSFTYSAPYSNGNLTEGFSVGMGYTQNREITYKTSTDNSPLRFRGDDFIRQNFSASLGYNMRKGFYRRHTFSLGFSYSKVDDSVTKHYNPQYFNNGKNNLAYTDLAYNYQYINTNNINYPLTGKLFSLTVAKRGLGLRGGINMLSIDADFNKFYAHGKKWFSTIQSHVRLKAPFSDAFINQSAMGYGELYLQGLENYVIDAMLMGLAKYSLKRKLISFNIPVPFKNKLVSKIPVTLFAKTFTNLGFSYIQKEFETLLNNRLLYTAGVGIDILTLYDLNFRVEYSFNQLGEKGIFLHAKGGF